jgi:hypothetical protein
MTSTQLLSFLLTAVALLAVPGPSVLFAVSRGLTYGRQAAVTTVAGTSREPSCKPPRSPLGRAPLWRLPQSASRS